MVHESANLLFRREATVTLKALRQRIQWKPGKAASHLEKRKVMGHLPQESSVEDYNGVIRDLVSDAEHAVYVYRFGSERYYAIKGPVSGMEWLVIATRDGVVETAFPPDRVDEYLHKRGFVLIGTINEVLA